jgi:hypothetical protein
VEKGIFTKEEFLDIVKLAAQSLMLPSKALDRKMKKKKKTAE